MLNIRVDTYFKSSIKLLKMVTHAFENEMKKKLLYPRFVIKTAVMIGFIMVVAPAVSQIPSDVLIDRFLLGLPIGAISGAIWWPIGAWYKKRENAAIRQMQKENVGISNTNLEPISGSQ